jgi:hypothetical protein
MPEMEKTEFKFPDEVDQEVKDDAVEAKAEPDVDIEVVDDTPPQDRGRKPLEEPPEEVTEDELSKYDKSVQARIKKFTHGYHDERRAKEAALREREEALRIAQQLLEENKKLKEAYSTGEKTYIETVQGAAESQLQLAKRNYKEALESGDSELIADAQIALNEATYKAAEAKRFKPTTLQESEKEVQIPQSQVQQPQIDSRTAEWLDENPWYGDDDEMSATAMGLHHKLEKQFGKDFVGSEDYFKQIDATMRKRYPEYFGSDVKDTTEEEEKPQTRAKPAASVVAPAARSTAPKKVKLTQTQVAIAKKLGVPLELYAKKVAEQMNGGQ